VTSSSTPPPSPREFVKNVHGIRYQVTDVARAVAFYSHHLGFKLEHQHLPQFAALSLGDTTLLLSGPGASGSRALPDGVSQKPGGWNRIVLHVVDLPACVAAMKQAGLRFRNDIEVGPAGRQVQIEDPDGNPIELSSPQRVLEVCARSRGASHVGEGRERRNDPQRSGPAKLARMRSTIAGACVSGASRYTSA